MKSKPKRGELYSQRVIFIPGSVPSSKNSRRRTRSGTFIASKAVYKYRKLSKEYWERKRQEFLDLIKDREPPYLVGFHFIKKTRHKFDWVNPLQTVQDLMVQYDWIEDDNIEVLVPFPFQIDGVYHGYDKSNAGVYIYVP